MQTVPNGLTTNRGYPAAVIASSEPVHRMDKSQEMEEVAVGYLRSLLPELLGDVDVRNNPAYFKLGIDFLWNSGVAIDLKAEFQKGFNCAAEVVSQDRPSTKVGWLLSGTATWVVHYFPNTGDVIVIPSPVYRRLVHKYIEKAEKEWKSTSCKNKTYMSWCVLVPVKEVAEAENAFWLNVGIHDDVREKDRHPSKLIQLGVKNRIQPEELVARLHAEVEFDTPATLPPVDIAKLERWVRRECPSRDANGYKNAQYYLWPH